MNAYFQLLFTDTYSCLPGQGGEGIAGCVKCQKGYYKELSDRSECIQCGQGRTTADIGTLFENDCLSKSYIIYEQLIVAIILKRRLQKSEIYSLIR